MFVSLKLQASMGLTVLEISCKWNHTALSFVTDFICLGVKFHLQCGTCQNFLFKTQFECLFEYSFIIYFYVCRYFACMLVCVLRVCLVPEEASRRQIPGTGVTGGMSYRAYVGTRTRISGGVTRVPNCWAISLAPYILFCLLFLLPSF